nr:hypothetical protein KitaXyl93_54940 [Kitasatospora sp. Xyl93]
MQVSARATPGDRPDGSRGSSWSAPPPITTIRSAPVTVDGGSEPCEQESTPYGRDSIEIVGGSGRAERRVEFPLFRRRSCSTAAVDAPEPVG